MIISLVAYILGFLVVAAMLGKEMVDFADKREMIKSVVFVIGVALLWPVFGVWILWEAFDIWMVSRNNQVGEFRDEHRQV